MSRTYRVGVIGSTCKGDYGHGHDTAFLGLDRARVVALADDNPEGLGKMGVKLGVERLYSDYQVMLEKEGLDIVSIGPRWTTERVAMVEAAAAAGCHIYIEKPFAAHLENADRMMAACRKAGIKIVVAHQFRGMDPVRKAIEEVKAGTYGRLLRMHARPKDDRRGGGEELIVHGTHLFDLMIAFAGRPTWVSGHICVGERDATKADRREATEQVGPVAGDSVAAMFGFPHGVRGFFDSTANLDRPGKLLYGLLLECESALLHIRRLGNVFIYPSAVVLPDEPSLTWGKMVIPVWHFTPDGQPRPLNDWLHLGNKVLVNELMDAIENGREPNASGEDARFITEMVQGVNASHFQDGRRLPIPLEERRHPLDIRPL